MINSKIKSQNLSSERSYISYEDRISKNGHRGAIIWLTGLSGAGKSTVAQYTQKKLFENNKQVYVLDGDNIRKKLNRDLGFNKKDRGENIRRIAEIARLFADAGFVVITSFISPYEKDRQIAREIAGNFLHIIYIKASLEDCKRRDPKGHYKRASTGEIKNFTGVSDNYEEPSNPDLIINTENNTKTDCVDNLVKYINQYI